MECISLVQYRLLPLFIAIFCMLPACISRNNPWDPVNGCHPDVELPEIRSYYQAKIEATTNKLPVYDSRITLFSSMFDTLTSNNTVTIRKNRTLHDSITGIIGCNDSIALLNSLMSDCEPAQFKNSIGKTFLRVRTGTSDSIKITSTHLQNDRTLVDSLFTAATDTCPGQIVFLPEIRTSLLALYDNRKNTWAGLIDSMDRYAITMADTNRVIDNLNRNVRELDSLIDAYNDSLRFCKLTRLSDSLEIVRRLDSLMAGDTLALDPGVYRPEIYLRNRGTDGTFIVITGAPGGGTVIDGAPRIEIEGSNCIRFENFVFNNIANDNGVRIWGGSNSIQFDKCTFSNNAEYGLYAFDGTSDLSITNCVFTRNGEPGESDSLLWSGIRIKDCGNVVLRNILVADNYDIGIDILSSPVELYGATVSDNVLYGLRYGGSNNSGTCVIQNTIFSFNGSYGIFRNNETTTVDVIVPASTGNRFFGNGLAEMGGNPVIADANKPFLSTEDPLYTDRGQGDYHTNNPVFGRNIGYQYP